MDEWIDGSYYFIIIKSSCSRSREFSWPMKFIDPWLVVTFGSVADLGMKRTADGEEERHEDECTTTSKRMYNWMMTLSQSFPISLSASASRTRERDGLVNRTLWWVERE